MIDFKKAQFSISGLGLAPHLAETLLLADLEGLSLISMIYQNDIEAINECNTLLDALDLSDGAVYFNPLFFPSSDEEFEQSFEPSKNSGEVKFLSDPNVIYSKTSDNLLSRVVVSIDEMPVFEEIIAERKRHAS